MSELTDLYPALAAVAAITTAIQTPIALETFSACGEKVNALRAIPGQPLSDSDRRARRTLAIRSAFLNFPATIVNALVIVPWGYLIYAQQVKTDEWVYFAPWLGVAIAALFLFLLVATSVMALWAKWWVPAVVSSLIGVVAVILMVARETHAQPF